MCFTSGRGSVRVDSQTLWPKSTLDSASTLQSRRIWKLMCRMKEVQKKPFGYLAEKTWTSSRNLLKLFPHDLQVQLEPILQLSPSSQRAASAIAILDTSLLQIHGHALAFGRRNYKVLVRLSIPGSVRILSQLCILALPTNRVSLLAI